MKFDHPNRNDNVKEYYGILRTRQMQIIQIIRETTFLLGRMDAVAKRAPSIANEKNLDGGLRLAFGMLNSLSAILDEQVKALDVFERVMLEDREPPRQSFGTRGNRDYYEINPN